MRCSIWAAWSFKVWLVAVISTTLASFIDVSSAWRWAIWDACLSKSSLLEYFSWSNSTPRSLSYTSWLFAELYWPFWIAEWITSSALLLISWLFFNLSGSYAITSTSSFSYCTVRMVAQPFWKVRLNITSKEMMRGWCVDCLSWW